MSDEPYTKAELLSAGDSYPGRGELCEICNYRIPQFADLTEPLEQKVHQMIRDGRKLAAITELTAATGAPLGWAKLWVVHNAAEEPQDDILAPCPHCGKPLRTPRAKQCRFCGSDWHD